MTSPPAEAPHAPDPRLRVAIRAVAVAGAGLTLAGLAFFGARVGLAVAAGAALAAGNLVALARIVGAMLPTTPEGARAQSRAGWGLLAALKIGALFAVLWLLMRHAALPPLGVLAGFGALPIGIAIGAMLSDRGPAPP